MHARHAYTNRPDPTRPKGPSGYYGAEHRRLTWDLVDRLRAEYRPHVMGHGQCSLAARYGLDRGLVRRVVLYLTWTGPRPTSVWDVFPRQGRRGVSG